MGNTKKYPEWATNAYKIDLKQIETIKTESKRFCIIGFLFCTAPAIEKILYPETKWTQDYLFLALLVLFVFGIIAFLVGTFDNESATVKENTFKKDWERLRNEIETDVYETSEQSISDLAYVNLVIKATKVKIFQLLAYDKEQEAETNNLKENYILFMKFGLVPFWEDTDNLPLSQFFEKTESQIPAILNGMIIKQQKNRKLIA